MGDRMKKCMTNIKRQRSKGVKRQSYINASRIVVRAEPYRPILQVALDLMNAHRALQIAREAVAGGADWLEAGTPLIKSEGVQVVRELKRNFPGHKVVADMKTLDVGGFETEIAAKAGADIVVIMGVSDDSCILEAVRAARKYGANVMVDLMGVSEPEKRATELERMGVDYLCIHAGIDEQMVGGSPMNTLKRISSVVELPVAVAGGVTTETAADALRNGAQIVIVGGAIVKAADVVNATKAIRTALDRKIRIPASINRKYKSEQQLKMAFLSVSTPNISDAMHRKGAMVGILPGINKGVRVAGRAVVVRTADGDWAKPVEAIDVARKGDIIVVDAGSGHTAIWGELASWSCKTKGIEAVVIDGAVRDIDEILKINFPVFARYFVPNAGEPKGHGEIGAEIICGGQTVRTGDWIIGDENGVVVVPAERATEIANRALDVCEKENRIREEIKRGSTLSLVEYLHKWEKVQ